MCRLEENIPGGIFMSKRTRRTFSQEFKQQIVNLYLAGKPRVEIIREYELTASAFDKWVKQSKTSGSFKEKDNLTPEQKELLELRKRNQQLLGLSRQSYYYQSKPKKDESELEEVVAEEFIRSRKAYGSRKIKKALSKRGIQISRRKISRIMKNRGLKSSYTVAYFKVHHSTCNEAKTTNVLNRKFLRDNPLEAIVTDLTYVRVGKKWNYVCFILDLFNREILGYSCGEHKDAVLVKKAFSRIKQPLTEVEIFHTDRGKEFDNQAIDELLTTFDINRSLSHKGCPFDNAVAESTYKSLKVEFVYQYTFETLQQLDLELFDYVNWWNHLRLHGTLGYETPVGYRNQRLAQRILDNELGCANASEAV